MEHVLLGLEMSPLVSITFGVPQGSVLGTFFIFINVFIYKIIFGQYLLSHLFIWNA